MSTSDHQAIRDYLKRESDGKGNSGKKMILNPRTGKFEIVSAYESASADAPVMTSEDLRSFAAGRHGGRPSSGDAKGPTPTDVGAGPCALVANAG